MPSSGTPVNTWYIFDGDLLIGEVGTPYAVGGGGGVGGGSGLEVLELAGPYVPQQGAAVAQMAYTWGAAGLVSSRSLPNNVEGGSNWYHFGPQGETRYLSGAAGAPVAYTQYSGYGIASGGLAASSGFNFGGQFGYYTDYAGILCGARWYDPAMGRWLSRDPIDYAGGDNLYAYCYGDPVGGIDPDGLQDSGGAIDYIKLSRNAHGATPQWIKKAGRAVVSNLRIMGHEALVILGLRPAENSVEQEGQQNFLAFSLVAGAKSGPVTAPTVFEESAPTITKCEPRLQEIPNGGGENLAAKIGRERHLEFKARVAAKKGWDPNPRGIDPKTGKEVRPDTLDPFGRPIEYKPNTARGKSRGKTQLKKYERAFGKKGRVIYYDK